MAKLTRGTTFTSLFDIKGEFGVTTLQNLSIKGTRQMYVKIFDQPPSSGENHDRFDGTGKPEGTNGAIGQECSGGQFRPLFTGNIDFYGGPTGSGVCSYRWKYDTSPLWPSPSYTATETTSSNGSVSGTVNSFDFAEGNDVYSELQVWNEYNEDAVSDYATTDSSNSTTFTKDQLNTPTLSSGTVEHDGNEFYLEFAYGDGDTAGGYDVEMRVDGTPSTQNPMGINCTDYGGTQGNIQGIQGQQNPVTVSETVEFRVRAKASLCGSQSAFSAWQTSTQMASVPSCPITV